MAKAGGVPGIGSSVRMRVRPNARRWRTRSEPGSDAYWGDTPENMMKDFAALDRAYETTGTRPVVGDHPFEAVRNAWMGPQNYFAGGSVVDIPQIWDVEKQASIHHNGNTNSVLGRNVISAIATFYAPSVEAVLDADPRQLDKIGKVSEKIDAPLYPEDVFGPIDREKAARGADLYAKYCVACHATTLPEGEVTDLPRFTAEESGTDEAYFDVFEKPVLGIAGVEEQSYGEAIVAVMADFTKKWFERYEITPKRQHSSKSRILTGSSTGSGSPAHERDLGGGAVSAQRSVPTMYDLLLRCPSGQQVHLFRPRVRPGENGLSLGSAARCRPASCDLRYDGTGSGEPRARIRARR